MSAEAPQPAHGRWSDVDGAHISLFCWVEQAEENPDSGALFSRLHQRGQVTGRGTHQLYVRFAGEGQLIGVPPQLLRLLPEERGGY